MQIDQRPYSQQSKLEMSTYQPVYNQKKYVNTTKYHSAKRN